MGSNLCVKVFRNCSRLQQRLLSLSVKWIAGLMKFGLWNSFLLSVSGQQEAFQQINFLQALSSVCLVIDLEDNFCWSGDSTGFFPIKTCYFWLLNS